jgi:hypothetical protein
LILVILWLWVLILLIPILQIPRRGGYSTYQIPTQHCLYNSTYMIEIFVKMIPWLLIGWNN